jgi:PIN domain
MSMPLERRLQVLLDDERHRRLVAVAAERGVSVATVVREAIDRGLPAGDGRRRAAGRRLLEAPDMPVPEPHELLAEQEFAQVWARRRGRADAASLARDYGELLSPLLLITTDSLIDGLRLFESAERLGAFDAVLGAAAIASGASAFVSVDTAFAEVATLTHVIPDAEGVELLLANPGQ